MPSPDSLVIGTRGSPLAMAQAKEARCALAAALGRPVEALTLMPFTTTGDAILDRPLAEAGGKGLFTKELDAALLDGRIDLAVHSAKDLPTVLPDGIVIAACLTREDPRDALVAPGGATSLAGLPAGCRVGTASPRRAAIVLRARPDATVTLLRGNVGTRLAKIERGEADATLLAVAGLNRLGLGHEAAAILSPDEMLPACGQGIIAVTARSGDGSVCDALAAIGDPEAAAALAAERAYLAVLDGSCRTPIAGHARMVGGTLVFRGLVLRPDGRDAREVALEGPAVDAERIGREAGLDLRGRLPAGMLAA